MGGPAPVSPVADAMDPGASEFQRVLGLLRDEVGDTAYRSWLQSLRVERVENGEAVVAVPTRFLRTWIADHYADRLLALWRGENPAIVRLSLIVESADRLRRHGRRSSSGRFNGNNRAGRSARRRRRQGSAFRTARLTLHLREFHRRQAQRAGPCGRPAGRRSLRRPGAIRAVQSAFPVWRRRPRQDAPDARDRLAYPAARPGA